MLAVCDIIFKMSCDLCCSHDPTGSELEDAFRNIRSQMVFAGHTSYLFWHNTPESVLDMLR